MERMPFRRLAVGPPPHPDRVFYHSIWFRGHNNPLYAELIPRLDRLDRYLLTLSANRVARGVEWRVLRRLLAQRLAAVFRYANRRYRWLFTGETEQLAYFSGRAIAMVDDPTFSPRELELLNGDSLAAYIVTKERAARRFESLGVEKPWYVISQGLSLRDVTDTDIARVREGLRRDGEIVVGYHAAVLLSAGDRGGDRALLNVDHLLDLWDEIHARVPRARLWLMGDASARVRRRCVGREDIVLHGRVPRATMLAHVANFDIAVYARAADDGIQAAKIQEYIGLGVPTVSYDYEVTSELRETGAGVLVKTPREFVGAVEELANSEERRRALSAAGRAVSPQLDWDVLVERYEEVFDLYFPRARAVSGTASAPLRPPTAR